MHNRCSTSTCKWTHQFLEDSELLISMYLQVSKMPDERQHTAWEKSSDLRLRLVQTASTVMSWTSAVHKGKLKCGRIPPTIPTPFKECLTYCCSKSLENQVSCRITYFEHKNPLAVWTLCTVLELLLSLQVGNPWEIESTGPLVGFVFSRKPCKPSFIQPTVWKASSMVWY